MRRRLPIALLTTVVVAGLGIVGRRDQLRGIEPDTRMLMLAVVLLALAAIALRWIHRYARVQVALKAQLRQAQKLATVGQLAVGIAHDFNNLLTVIGGCSGEALERATSEQQRLELREIQRTADRATALTRQLLAFTRPQVAHPSVFDLSAVVEDLAHLLERLLGTGVEVRTIREGATPVVRADQEQVERAIVNLAVNARDAMPRGGILTLSTSEVEFADTGAGFVLAPPPGRYVRLTVQDSGSGIDDNARGHIFEPFFTTKGEGTGLGLAIVRDILEQNRGGIALATGRGSGTTFELYFRADVDPVGTLVSSSP